MVREPWVQSQCQATEIQEQFFCHPCVLEVLKYLCSHLPRADYSSVGSTTDCHVGDPGSSPATGHFLWEGTFLDMLGFCVLSSSFMLNYHVSEFLAHLELLNVDPTCPPPKKKKNTTFFYFYVFCLFHAKLSENSLP